MNESEQQVAVVTGATAGIGRWIALGLAHAGHHVVMIARDAARGDAAAAWIGQRVPSSSIEVKLADLSSLAATQRAGQEIAASTRRAARQQCGHVHRASAGHGRRPRARAGGEGHNRAFEHSTQILEATY
jgi:NAD(P)-dependent dehydrogenase (short-subunit alcohol dehydrogenase family)